jgi:two-component system, chemotaxis family, CheB/CheR fusion protein
MERKTGCEQDVTAPNRTENPVVVGIGASAGGLEAVQRFLKHMPQDSGMVFVLVQHLDPGHESILSDLLAHHTKIPIEQIRDESLAEADHAYVIPPKASLTIERGVLRLGPPLAHHGVRTPIDVFFKSLARDRGGKAVGIILSGTGSDGTAGLRAIKESGGLTIAQNPQSAAHDSMPQNAIAAAVTDCVLTPEEMPARLIEHLRRLEQLGPMEVPGGGREELPDYLSRIRAIVQRKTGHDFNYYKQNTLVRRIRRRMDTLRLTNPSEYEQRLEQDPEEAEELLSELLINVTDFFRDPEAFESLAHSVIPKLFEGRNPDDQFRLWVVGCASGEEVYSFAILLREQMTCMGAPVRAQIFATDIDEQALAAARQGRYPHSIAERISPERLERFFITEDGTYRVNPELRDMCVFSRHNVIQDPPFIAYSGEVVH